MHCFYALINILWISHFSGLSLLECVGDLMGSSVQKYHEFRHWRSSLSNMPLALSSSQLSGWSTSSFRNCRLRHGLRSLVSLFFQVLSGHIRLRGRWLMWIIARLVWCFSFWNFSHFSLFWQHLYSSEKDRSCRFIPLPFSLLFQLISWAFERQVRIFRIWGAIQREQFSPVL